MALPSAPLPEGFRWDDPPFIGDLYDAFAVRLAAVGIVSVPLLGRAAGNTFLLDQWRLTDDLDYSAEGTFDRIELAVLQQWLARLDGGPWLKEHPLTSFTGPETTTITQTFPVVSTGATAEKPDGWLLEYYSVSEIWEAAGFLSVANFTRKLPRYIEGTGDGGSPAQRARRVERDGSGYVRKVFATVYEYGSGAWEPIDPALVLEPDELESKGYARPGDRIEPWIFNELLSVLEVLKYYYGAFEPASGETLRQRVRKGQSGNHPSATGSDSYATATSNARAVFDGSVSGDQITTYTVFSQHEFAAEWGSESNGTISSSNSVFYEATEFTMTVVPGKEGEPVEVAGYAMTVELIDDTEERVYQRGAQPVVSSTWSRGSSPGTFGEMDLSMGDWTTRRAEPTEAAVFAQSGGTRVIQLTEESTRRVLVAFNEFEDEM